MMNKSQLRSLLILEINHMDENSFHHVCVEFLSHKTKSRFINTGVNRNNRPIGHDLDAISSDSQMAGEFTVEQGYFLGRFTKLRSDLAHSLNRIPRPQTIFLISSQSCSPLNRKKIEYFLKLVSFTKRRSICFYDANHLVDEMIDLCKGSELFRDSVANYMLTLRQVMILFASDNTFPLQDPDYVSRGEESKLQSLVLNNQFVLVYGISGSGKSQLLIRVKDRIKDKFDHSLWINGEDLKELSSLKSYSLERHGHPFDVWTMLKQSNVLLHIDSLEGKDQVVHDLHQIPLSEGSRIIITSQKQVKAEKVVTLQLNGLNSVEFSNLINKTKALSSEAVERFFKLSAGQPLVASIVHKMIRHQDLKNEEILTIASDLGNLEAGNNKSILETLLGSHYDLLESGFSFIKTLSTPKLHKKMTQYVLGVSEIHKLRNRGFLEEGTSDYYHVHDLVFNAICMSSKVISDPKWNQKIIDLFTSKDQLSELEFFQISNAHFDLITKNAWESNNLTAQYLVCTYLEVDSKFNVQNFRQALEQKIKATSPQTLIFIEAMLVIEYYEILYKFYRYQNKDLHEAKKMAEAGLGFCNEAIQTNISFKKNLLHHAGKFSFHLKMHSESIEFFEAALLEDPEFSESKLQLFRRYHWVNTDKESTSDLKRIHGQKAATTLITSILEKANVRFEDVPPPVLLHSFQEMRKAPFYGTIQGLLVQYKELFYQTITTAHLNTRIDYVDVLAGFGDRYIKLDVDEFLSFISKLSFPAPDLANGKINFSLAQMYKNIAKEKRSQSILGLASLYYDLAIQLPDLGDFELNHVIDHLNLTGQFLRAEELYQRLKNKDDAFCSLRRACTLNGLGKHTEALTEVDSAIRNLPSHLKELHEKGFQDLKDKINLRELLETSESW